MTWQSPDLNDDQIQQIQRIHKELRELFSDPQPMTVEEVANLTEDQALMVRIHTRRLLLSQLLFQEYHLHEMDDCGDYLTAALDNYYTLHTNLWNNDFQNEVEETKSFLTDFEKYPEGGCDGEVRYDLLKGDDDDEPLGGIALRIRQHLGG